MLVRKSGVKTDGKYHFVWHGGLLDCVGTYRKGAGADISL